MSLELQERVGRLFVVARVKRRERDEGADVVCAEDVLVPAQMFQLAVNLPASLLRKSSRFRANSIFILLPLLTRHKAWHLKASDLTLKVLFWKLHPCFLSLRRVRAPAFEVNTRSLECQRSPCYPKGNRAHTILMTAPTSRATILRSTLSFQMHTPLH